MLLLCSSFLRTSFVALTPLQPRKKKLNSSPFLARTPSSLQKRVRERTICLSRFRTHHLCVCVCFRSRAKKRTTHLYTARRDVKKKPKEYSHIFAGKFFSKGRISAKIHHFFPHLSRVTRTETNTHENSPHGQCETLSANVTFLSSRQKISTPRRGHCFFAIWLFS